MTSLVSARAKVQDAPPSARRRSPFVGFVRKEFRHILRDRRTLLVLFGMPVIMMALFGFAIRNEIEDVRVAVAGAAGDPAASSIVAGMRASGTFDVVEQVGSAVGIDEAFQHGRIMAAIVFEPGFAAHIGRPGGAARIQIITDATNPNTASTVQAYTAAVVREYQRDRAAERAPSAEFRPDAGTIQPEFRMRYNPELKSVYLFVPGLMALILMLVSALMTSITITREREMGSMEVLLVSPLHPVQIIVGKVIPYLALSMVNVATILLLAAFVFAVPVRGSLTLLIAEAFLFTLCALSLGILISSRSTSLQTSTMIALAGLLMPTVLLSGFIFPIASMPDPLQVVSHIVPAKWFLIIVRGIMIRGVGLEFVWTETLIIAGMTLLFMGVSVRSFNLRLE